jgi:photosystem II stability/assembly factor-like uncharacterized protein
MRRAVLVVTLVAAIAGTAAANTRFPATNGVTLQRGAPGTIAIGTTFGLLLTHDEGKHMYWVCEQAVGYGGLFDPTYAITRDGTIFAAVYDGLHVSRDGGCTFNLVAVEPGAKIQKDVLGLELGPNDEIWLSTTSDGMANDVFESTDGGHTFQSKGLASNKIWWKAVKVAPSNGMRVYASGYQVTSVADDGGTIDPLVHVKRSDNGGASWMDMPTTDFTLATNPSVLISAVSPTKPDLVFARSENANGNGDRLYRSEDAAAHWTDVLDTSETIRAVLVLHSGDVMVATTAGGVFRSTDDGKTFQAITGAPEMACAAQREDGTIFSCGANGGPDFMARGTARAPAGPFTKVFRFVELTGPLACPDGTTQRDVCDLQLWPALKEQFGITDAADAMPADGAPPRKSKGCCDSSGDGDGIGTLVIVLAVVAIGGLLVRRGKKRGKKDCCS